MARLRKVSDLLAHEIQVLTMQQEISSQARGEIDRSQREYFLRQQLKAIQQELGEGEELAEEIAGYRKLAESKKLGSDALEEMERHYGKRPIIYTTVDFYEANLSNGALMDYPIWVRSTKHHPAVKYGSRAWHFWQYQSDGRVPGIGGNVDKDAFFGSKDQWDAFQREPGVSPVQTAAAKPAPAQMAAQPQESVAEPASTPAE